MRQDRAPLADSWVTGPRRNCRIWLATESWPDAMLANQDHFGEGEVERGMRVLHAHMGNRNK
jgi:hypothetical protein